MNPWKLIFFAVGWGLLAWIAAIGIYSLCMILWQFARDLWDARGEPPEPFDYTSTADRWEEPK